MRILRYTPLAAASVLGAALLAPEAADAFTLAGFSLGIDERGFALFDNFTNPEANANTTPHPQFPGYVGAEMAVWKAFVEWGSGLHGDGTGDPTQPGDLGSGGANFDPSWQGNASGPGALGDRVVSAVGNLAPSVVGFVESPGASGWRIRLNQDLPWSDDPAGAPAGTLDLQGALTYYFGVALGLGNSSSPNASMAAAGLGSAVGRRSIELDDIAGIQAIYGAASATKPRVTATSVQGGVVTLDGENFHATGNEVWFTRSTPGSGSAPVIAAGVPSTSAGTRIELALPAAAGPGDVLVRVPGSSGGALSNAFPFATEIAIESIAPTSVPAVIVDDPGLSSVLLGSGFAGVHEVRVDGVEVPEFEVLDDTRIAFTPPWLDSLGSVDVSLSSVNGGASVALDVVANDPPALDVVPSLPELLAPGAPVSIRMGSAPGDLVLLGVSRDLVPSSAPGLVDFAIGSNFQTLFLPFAGVIPSSGWLEVGGSFPNALPGTVLHWQAAFLDQDVGAFPLLVSNLQTVEFGS